MKMRVLCGCVLAGALVAGCVPSTPTGQGNAAAPSTRPASTINGFIATNMLRVNLLADGLIWVERRYDASPTDYWCAAGDFAIRALGAKNTTRLWAAKRPAGGPETGWLFTFNQAEADPARAMQNFGSGPKNGSVSVGMAQGSYCRRIPFIEPFF